MIGKLRGVIDSYNEDSVVIDVHGVGYLVHCSVRTLQSLPAPGEAATISIETWVREDQIRLYGFATDLDREWFRILTGVQGVGAKVALAVLGTLKVADLANAIALGDKAQIARAPGVGTKARAASRHRTEGQGAGLRQCRSGGGALARRPRRAARAAAGERGDLGAGQSRLWGNPGERRDRRRYALGGRQGDDGIAHSARA